MKSWEIIAYNLSKADWSWGCVSAVAFQRARDLDYRHASRRRQAFRCASGWKTDRVLSD